jgi:hypothetical protein
VIPYTDFQYKHHTEKEILSVVNVATLVCCSTSSIDPVYLQAACESVAERMTPQNN